MSLGVRITHNKQYMYAYHVFIGYQKLSRESKRVQSSNRGTL